MKLFRAIIDFLFPREEMPEPRKPISWMYDLVIQKRKGK